MFHMPHHRKETDKSVLVTVRRSLENAGVMMRYKGYYGRVDYDSEAKIFHGELVGMRAVITFQGTTVEELETAFKDSINDYLDWCKKRKKQPENPFSGKWISVAFLTLSIIKF